MTNHITPIVLAIIKNNDKYFLTKRVDKENPQFNGKWQIVGGGLEFGETIESCLQREVLEETALVLKSWKILPGPYQKIEKNWHGILFVFVCEITDVHQKIVLDKEANEFGWFAFEEVKKLDLFPNSINIFQDAQNL